MSRVIGKHSSVVSGYVYKNYGSNSASLSVEVNDQRIRDQGVAHNGYESVFALVPTKTGEWKRFELQYTGSYTDRGGGPPRDGYHLTVGPNDDVSIDDLRHEGVAFGVDVDSGHGETLWLQGYGDNYKLNE